MPAELQKEKSKRGQILGKDEVIDSEENQVTGGSDRTKFENGRLIPTETASTAKDCSVLSLCAYL